MWCPETLNAINTEAIRRARLGLPERDALFAVTDARFRAQEQREEQPPKPTVKIAS